MRNHHFRTLRIVLPIALVALANCGEGDRAKAEAEKAKKSQEEAERSARYKAEREAESSLFADPTNAEATLNRRIDDWITRQGGLILVRGEWSSSQRPARGIAAWNSMPSTMPWFIRCGRGGLSINLGNWRDTGGRPDEEVTTGNVFGLYVTNAPLSDDQCKELVIRAGKKMLAITAAP